MHLRRATRVFVKPGSPPVDEQQFLDGLRWQDGEASGLATVALLATFGPAAALSAFVGEKVAAAFLPDRSGQRPVWIRSVYNLAWGSPCIMFSWLVRGLAPDRTVEPVLIAVAWWLSNQSFAR